MQSLSSEQARTGNHCPAIWLLLPTDLRVSASLSCFEHIHDLHEASVGHDAQESHQSSPAEYEGSPPPPLPIPSTLKGKFSILLETKRLTQAICFLCCTQVSAGWLAQSSFRIAWKHTACTPSSGRPQEHTGKPLALDSNTVKDA